MEVTVIAPGDSLEFQESLQFKSLANTHPGLKAEFARCFSNAPHRSLEKDQNIFSLMARHEDKNYEVFFTRHANKVYMLGAYEEPRKMSRAKLKEFVALVSFIHRRRTS